jgi:hypothetical protein
MAAKNKSGEKLIEVILDKHKIRYDRRKKMKLKKDTKNYRIPDFYLPDYDMVIEFFGSWLTPENKKFEERERKRFMEKVGAYHQSKIHTLYLYPTQLIDAEKLIVKATKQISNLPVAYRKPLYWNIPWMKERKIEKPIATDFKKETKIDEVVKTVQLEEKTVEHKVKIIEEEPKTEIIDNDMTGEKLGNLEIIEKKPKIDLQGVESGFFYRLFKNGRIQDTRGL